ncbi:MAG: peptidase M15A [Parvibaculum sp.]|jgi:uncharacterized protein YcbK (DUF882 family)|nr:peptidase M15A [Parvibaculum sp.]
MEVIDWNKYPNFSEKEFACQHCGEHGIDERIVDVVQRIREEADFPFIITSGYRCVEHPIEKKKKNPGVHTSGLAVDIGASHEKAYIILKLAMQRNLPGIGINQKGNGRFIHLDISEPEENRPRPHLWSY